MKSSSQKPTCSAAIAHEGQTTADTNTKRQADKYRVQIFLRQTQVLHLTISAKSQEEAEARAFALKIDDLPHDNRDGLEPELYIDTVEAITGGQGND